jgi:hypothetical protein
MLGPALDDSWDEYCIIKYVYHLEKNIKEKSFKKATSKAVQTIIFIKMISFLEIV